LGGNCLLLGRQRASAAGIRGSWHCQLAKANDNEAGDFLHGFL
jgi:hypothetical protein